MKYLNKSMLKYLLLLPTVSILAACNSNSTMSNNDDNATNLGTLPTGSVVSISISPINIINLTPSTSLLNVSGGTPGYTYNFTFTVLNNNLTTSNSTPTISPNSCTITTGSNVNNCTLTINPNFASNGEYSVTVNYALVNNNQSNYIADSDSIDFFRNHKIL